MLARLYDHFVHLDEVLARSYGFADAIQVAELGLLLQPGSLGLQVEGLGR